MQQTISTWTAYPKPSLETPHPIVPTMPTLRIPTILTAEQRARFTARIRLSEARSAETVRPPRRCR